MNSSHSNFERGRHIYLLTAFLLFAALVLGGGTRAGFLGDTILQYLALPLLIIAAAKAASSDQVAHKQALWFCAALAIVPALQLIPLPPGIRALLPGYTWVQDAYTLIDAPPYPFWPISLTPHATWLALLSLVPPIAVFLGTMLLGQHDRARLAYLVLAVCGFSVFLGLMQLSQGPTSSLRPFSQTNAQDAVGFFANRNHYAALLYSGTALAAWLVLNAVKKATESRVAAKRKLTDSRALLVIAGAFTLFAILVIAQAMARSRAGIILSIVALLMVLPMVLADRRNNTSAAGTLKLVYAVAAFAVVFALQFALLRILARFEADPLQDARWMYARTTLRAAVSYLPFGAGTGSFVAVFPQFEAEQDLLRTFANRAHNDFAEAALESGVFAIALILFFAVWFVRQGVGIWRERHDVSSSYMTLTRAAWVVAGLLALHSIVDYPLRTTALASLAAFACAMLLPPTQRHAHHHHEHASYEADRESADEAMASTSQKSYSQSRHGRSTLEPVAPAGPKAAPRPYQKWDATVEWPEEWRKDPENAAGSKPVGWDVPRAEPDKKDGNA